MRYWLYVLLFFFIGINNTLLAQLVQEKGTVSYVSSQNVYVKFKSTEGINIGDTLFLLKGENLIPALQVTNTSSVSCVCSRLGTETFAVSDAIIAKKARIEPEQEENKEKDKKISKQQPINQPSASQGKKPEPGTIKTRLQTKQKIRARLSAASYSNFSERGENTRMRYAFSMQGNHINNSKFSTDTYITFRHTLNQWAAVKDNLNDALKIYSLSAKFDFDETTNLVVGRKINPKISSLGAVDGIQLEKGFGSVFIGAIAGARPDMRDYSINLDLMQGGAYIGLTSKENEKYHLSTLGIIEQHNKSAVDRRFVYFQHSDDLLNNLNVFGSMEMDLYQNINNEAKNTLSLTNLFVSLRYKFSRKLSATVSYDSRKNIIYYESYKSYIDQIIDNETRQGMRFGLNYRPTNRISVGVNTSWRFQKSNTNGAKNLNSYLNFNQIPFIKTSASITANFLQTSYIQSQIFGLKLMKDVFKGKVNTELYYRRVDYDFPIYGYKTNQNVIGGGISWQIIKKLSAYIFFEKTFDGQNNNYLLFNTKLMQRF